MDNDDNDDYDNVSFYYSEVFLMILLSLSLSLLLLSLLLSSLMIMMEILNDFLQVGNIVTFIISILETFSTCIFLSHFRTKGYNNVLTMSYNVMAQTYSFRLMQSGRKLT